jgi:hypothetical protein
MDRPTKKQLRSMHDYEIMHHLIIDESNTLPYRIEALRRLASTDNRDSIFSKIAKFKNGISPDKGSGIPFGSNDNDDDDDDDQPRTKVKTDEGGYWKTDRRLKEEEDILKAIATFKRDLPHYWNNKDGSLQKDPEEIEDFLESLEENEVEDYEDLTAPQQGLLQMIRRKHSAWMRQK